MAGNGLLPVTGRWRRVAETNELVTSCGPVVFWQGEAIPILAFRLTYDHQETPIGKASDLKMDDWELTFTAHFAGGEATLLSE